VTFLVLVVVFCSFQTETGKQVVRNYNKVAATLVEYEVGDSCMTFTVQSYLFLRLFKVIDLQLTLLTCWLANQSWLYDQPSFPQCSYIFGWCSL